MSLAWLPYKAINSFLSRTWAEHLAMWKGCSLFMQEVEGSTPTGRTSEQFSSPIDQDICTQCALSRKIVVSQSSGQWLQCHWLLAVVSALSDWQNCTCAHKKNYKHNKDGCMVLMRKALVWFAWATRGNAITRIGLQHQLSRNFKTVQNSTQTWT